MQAPTPRWLSVTWAACGLALLLGSGLLRESHALACAVGTVAWAVVSVLRLRRRARGSLPQAPR